MGLVCEAAVMLDDLTTVCQFYMFSKTIGSGLDFFWSSMFWGELLGDKFLLKP